MNRSLLFAVIMSAFAMSQGAGAGVIYGDIAGNTNSSGWGVGPGGGVNNYVAEGFTMTGAYNLQSVDILLSQFHTNPGSTLALSIFSNNAGVPGTDQYDLATNISIPLSGSAADVNLTGTGSFLLSPGVTYWLELYATNPSSATGSDAVWDGAVAVSTFAIVAPTGVGATEVGQRRTFGSGTSTSELRTAFQLNGILVPEPSTLVLGLFAASAFGALAIRKRRA
jgi:hypothetical protein